MKTSRNYEALIKKALQGYEGRKLHIAQRLGFASSTFCDDSIGGRILLSLVEKGEVLTRTTGKTLIYRLPEESEVLTDPDFSPEEKMMDGIIDSINGFLAVKKKEMNLDKINKQLETAVAEKEYFENLCKDYMTKIESLESEQARKLLKF